MASQGLPRACRLKRQRLIRPLFDRRRRDVLSVAYGSIRIVARVVPREETGESVPVQVGFSSGRGISRAVDRNRVKRLLREVFRLNQSVWVDLFFETDRTLTAMVLFRGDAGRAAEQIPRDLPTALHGVAERLQSVRQITTAPPNSSKV